MTEKKKGNGGERLLARTAIFDLVEAPECGAGFRPVRVRSKDWVTVVAERGGEFLTVRQLRHGIGREMTEFPCGMVEPGEAPRDAALRELEEETGVRPADPGSLRCMGGVYANPAFMTNSMTYWYLDLDGCAWSQGGQALDPGERLTAGWTAKDAFRKSVAEEGASSLMAAALWRYDELLSGKQDGMLRFRSSVDPEFGELLPEPKAYAVRRDRVVRAEEREEEFAGRVWRETPEYAAAKGLKRLSLFLAKGWEGTHERDGGRRRFVALTVDDGGKARTLYADGGLDGLFGRG